MDFSKFFKSYQYIDKVTITTIKQSSHWEENLTFSEKTNIFSLFRLF